jgi:putative heme iron utilization protein
LHISLATLIELMHECSEAALATQASNFPGYPYASAVPFVVDSRQRPLFLLSRLAEHSANLHADARAAIILTHPGEAPLLERPRATLIGDCRAAQPGPDDVERYLRYQPEASRYLALGDFEWFRMELKQARYVGGFARMGWLKQEELHLPPPAFVEDEALHTSLSALLPTGARLLGVDCWGMDLLHEGIRLRRSFPHVANSRADLEAAARKLI